MVLRTGKDGQFYGCARFPACKFTCDYFGADESATDNSNYVHLEVDRIVKATEKAFLLQIDDEEIWIPISQIADPVSYEEGDQDCIISITRFIAKAKGLD